jgi:hypothetical protein
MFGAWQSRLRIYSWTMRSDKAVSPSPSAWPTIKRRENIITVQSRNGEFPCAGGLHMVSGIDSYQQGLSSIAAAKPPQMMPMSRARHVTRVRPRRCAAPLLYAAVALA